MALALAQARLAAAQALAETKAGWHGAAPILGPDTCRQAIDNIIADTDGVLLVLEFDHRENRAEHFFLCDAQAFIAHGGLVGNFFF